MAMQHLGLFIMDHEGDALRRLVATPCLQVDIKSTSMPLSTIHVVPAYILSDRTLLDMLIRILSLDNLWLCYSGLAPYVALNAEVDPFLAYLFHRQP